MKHADIAIMANGSGRLGHHGVDPARYRGLSGGWMNPPKLLGIVGTWLERRRQRQALRLLDDRLLKDIGVSKIDVLREVDKPIWQA